MSAKFVGGDNPAALPGQQEDPPIAVGGDMQKVTYDTNDDGKVNAADSADEAGHAALADEATHIQNAEAAGVDHYYGTNAIGTRGMWPLPDFTGGGVSDAANVGGGVEVFKQKLGVVLQFFTLVAGSNITITPTGDTIVISSTAAGVTDGDKGDITVSGSGATWTIDDNVVTDAKLADVPTATFKGRTTAGSGDPENLTPAQATALLDIFTDVLKGLVPASGGGTTNFLRADGTWAAPPGGGGGSVDRVSNRAPIHANVTGGTKYLSIAANCSLSNNYNFGGDTIRLAPFVPPKDMTVKGLANYVVTPGNGYRMGIFNSSASDGTPTTLVADVTIGTGSGAQSALFGAPVVLQQGVLYWIGVHLDGVQLHVTIASTALVPLASNANNTVRPSALNKTQTYAGGWAGGLAGDWIGNGWFVTDERAVNVLLML